MTDRKRPTEAERYAAGERQIGLRVRREVDDALDRLSIDMGESRAAIVSRLVLRELERVGL